MGEKELSNIDITLFALFRLGGAIQPVDTEEIAIECWRLVPEKFCWKKYPQYPESEPARSALFDASKAKSGKLCRGKKRRTGWMLTVAGIDYVKARLPALEAVGTSSRKLIGRHREMDQYFASLEKTRAYKKFVQSKSCESIERHEFTDLLRCSLDASPRVLRERLEKLKARVHEASRDDFLDFLVACEHYFAGMLSEA